MPNKCLLLKKLLLTAPLFNISSLQPPNGSKGYALGTHRLNGSQEGTARKQPFTHVTPTSSLDARRSTLSLHSCDLLSSTTVPPRPTLRTPPNPKYNSRKLRHDRDITARHNRATWMVLERSRDTKAVGKYHDNRFALRVDQRARAFPISAAPVMTTPTAR